MSIDTTSLMEMELLQLKEFQDFAASIDLPLSKDAVFLEITLDLQSVEWVIVRGRAGDKETKKLSHDIGVRFRSNEFQCLLSKLGIATNGSLAPRKVVLRMGVGLVVTYTQESLIRRQ